VPFSVIWLTYGDGADRGAGAGDRRVRTEAVALWNALVARYGRKRNGRFGVPNGDKQTFGLENRRRCAATRGGRSRNWGGDATAQVPPASSHE